MKKSILVKLSMIAMIFALGMNCATAQTKFSVHAGLASPLGSFGDSRAENGQIAWFNRTDRAGAGMGFTFGMKMNFAVPSVKGLSVIATADFLYNGPNSDVKDWRDDLVDDELADPLVDDCSMTLPKYINVPIMVGANYEYKVSKTAKLWGEGALGLNIGKITKYTIHEVSGNSEMTYEMGYESNISFAFQIGAGVMLSDKFSIGAHYYTLGGQKIEGKWFDEEIFGGTVNTDDGKFALRTINPSMFVIRAGFHF